MSRPRARRRRRPDPLSLERDVAALLLGGLGVLGLVALRGPHRTWLEAGLGDLLHALLGRLAVLGPVALLGVAAWLAVGPAVAHARARAWGVALGLLAAVGWAHRGVPLDLGFAEGWHGAGGGLLGASVDAPLALALGPGGRDVALGVLALLALLLVVQVPLRQALPWPFVQLWRAGVAVARWAYGFVTEPVEEAPTEVEAGEGGEPPPAALPSPSSPEVAAGLEGTSPARREEPAALPDPVDVEVLPEAPPEPPAAVPAAPPAPAAGAYQTPPLDLLRRLGRARPRPGRDVAQRAAAVEEALRSFGVAARVVDVVQGPSITRFEVQPGPGVKVARIAALSDDLALALAATDVRIVAPIPGKAALGIEVPNQDVTPVYLRDVLESPEFQAAPSPLTVAIGQDIAGRPVVASLPELFHLLVAGATGSGKSIALNAMLISLLYKARPDQLKLVLIDPKMVELQVYNGIPHLWAPVVTDARKAAATLRQVVREMEHRYGLFTQAGTRDLPRYNAWAAAHGRPELPYVVVVIDELADLMLVARSEVEDSIQRLTQMARAAGIHLIVATQRPSVDVITGVIKANIPSRIALTVSSQVDSRTILDAAGAERLVGRGDMLFRPVGAQKLIRAQGAYVSDQEVEAVLDFLRAAGRPEYEAALVEAEPEGGAADPEDELFVRALEIVVETRQASVSHLQRRLRVGFTRAGRLVDMMEQRGFVGPHQGSKSREVLLTREEFQRLFGSRASGQGRGGRPA